MLRGVQIMLAWFHPSHDEVVGIYRIYTKYIQNIYKMYLVVKFFLHCDFKHFAVSDFGQTEKNWV